MIYGTWYMEGTVFVLALENESWSEQAKNGTRDPS